MKKGFTLLELIIVVIIIGILVSMALPKFISVAEKARAAEGKGMIGSLRNAQLRYYAQNSKYTAAMADLDIAMTASTNFNDAVPTATSTNLAYALRKSSGYTLSIGEGGSISCGGGTAPLNCTAAGF